MNPYNLVYLDPALRTAVSMSSTQEAKPHHRARFTNEEVIMMKLYYHWEHKTYREIAEMYNTGYQMVYGIINKRKYKNVPLNFMTKIPEEFHEATNNKYRSFKVKGHN